MSNVIENAILDHITGKATMTRPTAWQVALYSVTPSDAGGGTELTQSGYARQAWTGSPAAASAIANAAEILFGPAGENWPPIVAGAIHETAPSTRFLFWGPVTASGTPTIGQSIHFGAAGDLSVSCADASNKMTTLGATAMLDFLLRNQPWVLDPHIALYTVAPTRAGGGTEVPTAGGTGYARISLTAPSAKFAAADGGIALQTASAIAWAVAGANYGAAVVAAAVCASGTEGTDDAVTFWPVTSTVVNLGDTYSIPGSTIPLGMD
jgi:hypothetical protein